MNDELLFNKYTIYSIIQGHTESLKKKVQSIPANTVLNASEQDLVQAFVEEFQLKVPVIKDEDIYITHAAETQVDVSGDPMRRFIYDHRSGPLYVCYSSNPPRGEIAKTSAPSSRTDRANIRPCSWQRCWRTKSPFYK